MKAKNILLMSAMILSMTIGCSNQGNDNSSGNHSSEISSSKQSEESSNSSSQKQKPIEIDINLGDYIANLQNANSIYITNTSSSTKGMKHAVDNSDGKQVLAKTSTEYDEDGNVIDKNWESDITFTRIVTETKTTQINGEEKYVPNEDGVKKKTVDDIYIEFDSESNVTYSIFDSNDKVIKLSVSDNDKNDKNSTVGKIKVDGLEENTNYTVKGYKNAWGQSNPCPAQLEGTDVYSVTIYSINPGALLEIYDDSKMLVLNDIYDNCPSDLNTSLGMAKFSGLDKGGTYYYRSFNSDAIITSVGLFDSIKGTKEIDVLDYSISFRTYEGFTYQICDIDGTALINDFTDNCDKDDEPETGVAKIKGLEKNKTYVVKYSGLGEEIIETQQELKAEIDKTYVFSSRFTFTSFVAEGESARPSGDDLIIDEDGVAKYDKLGYYTDEYRQSFLIDNYTGLVYKIAGINIAKIEKRVLYLDSTTSKVPYGFNINDNNELEVFKLIQNSTITYIDVFGDNYNQYYVNTNDISGINNNTVFFSGSNYLYLNNGTVLKFKVHQTTDCSVTSLTFGKLVSIL